MSTRSTISLKISDSDKGKTFHFDKLKLPKDIDGCEDNFIASLGDVKITKDYLTIYHHWDGYPDGVGDTLVTCFNDYDAILNLLCGGDASSICGTKIVQYCPWRGENWKFVQPKQSKREPKVTEEYAYLFKDGKWWFKDYDTKVWIDLGEYLKDNNKE